MMKFSLLSHLQAWGEWWPLHLLSFEVAIDAHEGLVHIISIELETIVINLLKSSFSIVTYTCCSSAVKIVSTSQFHLNQCLRTLRIDLMAEDNRMAYCMNMKSSHHHHQWGNQSPSLIMG